MINDEGWIVTAAHIIEQLETLVAQEKETQNAIAERAAIEADTRLKAPERHKKLKALPRILPDSTHRGSAHWNWPGSALVDVKRHPHIDIAVGRLDPFDPAWISAFPVIKDPSKDFDPGASLCKEGYPFHSVTPTWDDVAKKFQIGANPIPYFPIEGIFTREVEIVVPGAIPPYPLKYLETSSPGLRGQSGGPTFDVHGAIWGIQSQTRHYALGFNPPIPGGKNGETEHQFLNVGWGVHASTVIGVLTELNVKHSVSSF